MKKETIFRLLRGFFQFLGIGLLSACVFTLVGQLLVVTFLQNSFPTGAHTTTVSDAAIMDRFDVSMNNRVSTALDGILAIDKIYWLRDENVIAPEPNPSNYGKTEDPSSLQWLLEKAEGLLDGQDTLFHADVPLMSDSQVHYYYDETLLVIVWQQKERGTIYTIAEVKIAHPSQLRRFLAGNTYGYEKQYLTTKMSADVNAVLGCSGDFYMYRPEGTVVYNGVVERADTSGKIDTCFIDDQGDLIFSPKGELTEIEQTQKFVDEHNIRFSLSFGPILIENGMDCTPPHYALGEVNYHYPRMALCQAGALHYYIVTANCLNDLDAAFPTLKGFTDFLMRTGCDKAYTLDGGQTATIALNDQHINPVQYGSQRKISDIFYFATALPEGA